MLISTKGRYALRVMVDLAEHQTGSYLPLKEVAERQEISEKYLEQIIAMLNKAGLVRSIRGARGGYVLNDAPSEYTVGRILEAVEGDMSVVDNTVEVSSDNLTDIVSNRLWNELDKSVRSVLDHVTLSDLLDWHDTLLTDQYMIL